MLKDNSVDNNPLTKGSHVFNPFILLIPALCDTCATSIMYVGLNMTYASSFQMFRGAVIIFTAVLSMGFLNKKLVSREWLGIVMVIIGLALVGLSDITMEKSDVSTNSILTGDLLIICAQVKLHFICFIYFVYLYISYFNVHIFIIKLP